MLSYLTFDVSADKPISLRGTNLKRKLLEEKGTNEWPRVAVSGAFELYFSFVCESRARFLEGKKNNRSWIMENLPNVEKKLTVAMKACFEDNMGKPVGPALLYKLYGYAALLDSMNFRAFQNGDRTEVDVEKVERTKTMLREELEKMLERNSHGLWAFLFDFKCAYCPEEGAFIQSNYRRPIVW